MHKIKQLFPQSLKNIYHLAQAITANFWYGFPSKKLKVIGVTGTDGKTTTVQMITKVLEEADKKVAMASTINYRINGQEEKNLSHFTTSSAFSVQKFIKKAVKAECEYLVLETSSHSLHQHRVWGVKYQVAVITNVTREHLDYHKTMGQYRKAKEMLFAYTKKNKGTVIVNLDMEKPEDYLKYSNNNAFAYSASGLQLPNSSKLSSIKIIRAENIELGIGNSSFNVQGSRFALNIPGMFNIENALAAICVGQSEQISQSTISKALAKIKNVPGRMETVPNSKGLNIIVDFALTPNALKKLYQLIDSVKSNQAKVIAVFGSCGERDRGKRPIMGKIVSSHADCIVLTNDEPYREDPLKIIEEIAAGIENKIENQNYWKITDRREAIKKAMQIAKAGDIIVVTGMGAEESMIVGSEKIPWNDRKVIEEELTKL